MNWFIWTILICHVDYYPGPSAYGQRTKQGFSKVVKIIWSDFLFVTRDELFFISNNFSHFQNNFAAIKNACCCPCMVGFQYGDLYKQNEYLYILSYLCISCHIHMGKVYECKCAQVILIYEVENRLLGVIYFESQRMHICNYWIPNIQCTFQKWWFSIYMKLYLSHKQCSAMWLSWLDHNII